jgi:hypothetical protein
LQELVNQTYQLSLQPGTDEALATSFKTLVHLSSLELAANAQIAQTLGYYNRTPQPDYTLSINLIHTVLRCNHKQPIEQTKEKEVPAPRPEEPVDFSKLSGLPGVTAWCVSQCGSLFQP